MDIQVKIYTHSSGISLTNKINKIGDKGSPCLTYQRNLTQFHTLAYTVHKIVTILLLIPLFKSLNHSL